MYNPPEQNAKKNNDSHCMHADHNQSSRAEQMIPGPCAMRALRKTTTSPEWKKEKAISTAVTTTMSGLSKPHLHSCRVAYLITFSRLCIARGGRAVCMVIFRTSACLP